MLIHIHPIFISNARILRPRLRRRLFPFHFQPLHLLHEFRNRGGTSLRLPVQSGLDLLGEVLQVDQHALLLRVSLLETHLLDADLALDEFVLAQDDGEGDAGGFGGLELLGEFGFDLV